MNYKNYLCDKENYKDYLKKYGVAVIPNILNQEEILKIREDMWSSLEFLTSKFETPIKKDDEKTWSSFYELLPIHSMLVQHYKIGHSQFVWDIRQNEKVVDIFSDLWQVKNDELLVSFDGLSFHLPPEITKKGFHSNRTKVWLHTDQSYKRNTFECVQGFVSAYDVNDNDATLVILEGSHKYHADFAKTLELEKIKENDKKTYAKLTKDWYKLSKDEIKFYTDKGCNKYCVKCPAGSLVLWDSRTIHQAIEPQEKRKIPNTRLIVYVCYTPRKLATKTRLNKKKEYFDNMRMTTHWPHKSIVFSVNPQTRGNPVPEVNDLPKPELNELGKKLAGF